MRKTIVISAINIFEGGALSLLQDCLEYLDRDLSFEYKIIAYVHKKSLLEGKNIILIELPLSRKSYFFRLYYEYIWFYFQSSKLCPFLWFSFHDITPNTIAKIKAVYCHNPSPFYNISFKEFLIEPTLGFFNKFYKYLYLINLNKNKYVVVQQNWLREKFISILNSRAQIIVANPTVTVFINNNVTHQNHEKQIKFFFPSYPRVFKNFECVCEATSLVRKKGVSFEMIITISGNENRYAKQLFKRYGNIPELKFAGLKSRDQVFELYQQCDVVVFPSKLETWGLPITEAKAFSKAMFVSDLPYAHETVGNYKKVSFFQPDDYIHLASLMEGYVKGNFEFDGNTFVQGLKPISNSWEQLFKMLLQ